MKIRKFLQSDAAELSKLMRETVVKSNSADYSKEAVRCLVDEYTAERLIKDSKKMHIFVASEESKLLGTISLVGDRVSRMFVLPEFQGQKIGSKLIRCVEKFAKKEGKTILRVRSSLTAYGFYQKLGYQKTRRASNKFVGPIVWMKKEL
ncbi:GNAT family N-acetyltransferase [Candidatus Peregrinibacteria bacterium]|nr:GNAT family N-acetyltransferase [Candidatus Peregrinibacteria bacterium]